MPKAGILIKPGQMMNPEVKKIPGIAGIITEEENGTINTATREEKLIKVSSKS